MLSRGHPELDAIMGATIFKVQRAPLENVAKGGGTWSAHLECLDEDGHWHRRDDIVVDLAVHSLNSFLMPGTRQRLVIECGNATKAADWHKANG